MMIIAFVNFLLVILDSLQTSCIFCLMKKVTFGLASRQRRAVFWSFGLVPRNFGPKIHLNLQIFFKKA